MAQKYLVRCKDATQTAGTGTLTLDNSTAANWQTPAQAVARTLLANGDTVRYTISDTSDPVLYEEGIGTIGSSGLTLTRDTVRQSSSGVSKISWPSGGARDVVIAWSPGDTALISLQGTDYTAATFATNLGLPRLAASNTFTSLNAFQDTSTSDVELRTTTNGRRAGFRLTSASGDLAVRYFAAGVEPLVFGGGGTTITVGATTTLSKSGGGNYDAFPAGTKMLFAGAPPAGWTRVNETNQAIIRLATAADTPNASGGSDSFFDGGWATDGHTLTVSEIPSHTHDVAVKSGAGPATAIETITNNNTGTVAAAAKATGGGGSHAHNMTTPFYRIACWATKN